MSLDPAALLSIAAALLAFFALLAFRRQRMDGERLRLLAEQALAGNRAEAETTRAAVAQAVHQASMELADRLATQSEKLVETRGDMANGVQTVRTSVASLHYELKLLLEGKLAELQKNNSATLGEIQKQVNEQLHAAVEKQMSESFARVIDQFAAVQKAIGDVQAVTAQIGDIKRLFANVKTRGGWGETQVRAMLDDILPVGAYEAGVRLRNDSADSVEFAVRMPAQLGEERPLLAIDAKFPVEDYERLLNASEAGDLEGERAARNGLERRIRLEARKIADKYICPPLTVEFAVMYLPTDALYAEAARTPGLIDSIGREQRVVILGPSLFPALLRTIHLGFVTLALEQKAGVIRDLLGATRTEMLKMDDVLEKLAKQAGTFTNTIERARTRTRAVGRKLRDVEMIDEQEAARLLDLDKTTALLEDEAAE
jgi:DNA recombination protein RmuC